MNRSQKAPLVSIILPVYNGEKFLRSTILSCLKQSFIDFELIIVNDCSTDKSLEIAEGFKKEDSRISIVSNQINSKLPASLNLGHNLAKGKFITWISDDNCFKINALKIMLDIIERTGVDIVYSDFELINEYGKFLKNVILNNDSILLGNIIGASFLYKKDVYNRNSGYNEDLHLIEDYDFWLRSTLHSTFLHIKENLYQYRNHGESLTSQINLGRTANKEFIAKMKLTYEYFFKNFDYIKAHQYSILFSELHQQRELNILHLLEVYKDVLDNINYISKDCRSIDFEIFKNDFDKRIRSAILYFKSNQNLEVLLRISYYNPKILLNYDKRRSIEIIKKCLSFKGN